jgi:hypothetical protein
MLFEGESKHGHSGEQEVVIPSELLEELEKMVDEYLQTPGAPTKKGYVRKEDVRAIFQTKLFRKLVFQYQAYFPEISQALNAKVKELIVLKLPD